MNSLQRPVVPSGISEQERMPAAHFQSESVAHYSVEAIEALAQIGGSKSHVNPGCRPKSKHKLEPFQCLYHPTQLRWVKIATQLDAPALGRKCCNFGGLR
jgi:hypothetical protein